MDTLKIIIPILCLIGIAYILIQNKKYQKDTSSTKEEIIKYFKEQNATNIENGIKTKDLPESISRNSYLLLMVKDKTLKIEKGKYYLNNK